MALYYFHTQTDRRSTDSEGVEFDSPREARANAIMTCGKMLEDAPDIFWGSRLWSVVVTDAAGLILWELSMHGVSGPAGAVFD